MRLLVSVRSAEEVAPALAGGADIIDAKEPELGSLGPVAPERLRAIVTQLPEETELSVALGDFSAAEQVAHAVSTVQAAGLAGCDGVLLDTHEKGGANLFDWISPVALRQLIGRARECRLLTAVAGGLRLEDLEVIGEAEPDVVGFRSAACRGGRNGRVSSMLVRELRDRLQDVHSGFLQ
jgi:uncharacterized protein (UPF0264 family)